jgi:hypothetical protein
MQNEEWCEHLEKCSKYSFVTYNFEDRQVVLQVQSWVCPECGKYGADVIRPDLQATRAG